MAGVVLTVIGDDQAGLVDALSGVIADHGGNWEHSHMTQLAGKFAGIVLVTVPDRSVDALVADLEPLRERGLLDITAERASQDALETERTRVTLHLVGVDQPGIVHDVSHALATLGVSIELLETATSSAPMSGETLFTADAVLALPAGVSADAITEVVEELAHQLMVDIDLHPESGA
jgi:glycine cleavage system regulatory protein